MPSGVEHDDAADEVRRRPPSAAGTPARRARSASPTTYAATGQPSRKPDARAGEDAEPAPARRPAAGGRPRRGPGAAPATGSPRRAPRTAPASITPSDWAVIGTASPGGVNGGHQTERGDDAGERGDQGEVARGGAGGRHAPESRAAVPVSACGPVGRAAQSRSAREGVAGLAACRSSRPVVNQRIRCSADPCVHGRGRRGPRSAAGSGRRPTARGGVERVGRCPPGSGRGCRARRPASSASVACLVQIPA